MNSNPIECTNLFDSHCHLDDPALAERMPAVLAAARQAGVIRCLIPGVHPDSWEKIFILATKYSELLPAVGLHPMVSGIWNPKIAERLCQYADSAVAIGEIGLDYHLDIPRGQQQQVFRAQLQIALEKGLPVLIHCRNAFQDLLRILKEEKVMQVGGVMHAFSGSLDVALECIRLGLGISVVGTITYRNAVRPLNLVRQLPLEMLLLETDAPDMSPEPYRGTVNEPALLPLIAAKVAEIKGIPLQQVADVTSSNAYRLFSRKYQYSLSR